MEKVKEKLAQLKAEIDSANGRYEVSESKLNELKLQYRSKGLMVFVDSHILPT
jgi:anti-sigma28 factor (negative regulator of flagellin synthesis)